MPYIDNFLKRLHVNTTVIPIPSGNSADSALTAVEHEVIMNFQPTTTSPEEEGTHSTSEVSDISKYLHDLKRLMRRTTIAMSDLQSRLIQTDVVCTQRLHQLGTAVRDSINELDSNLIQVEGRIHSAINIVLNTMVTFNHQQNELAKDLHSTNTSLLNAIYLQALQFQAALHVNFSALSLQLENSHKVTTDLLHQLGSSFAIPARRPVFFPPPHEYVDASIKHHRRDMKKKGRMYPQKRKQAQGQLFNPPSSYTNGEPDFGDFGQE